MERGTSKEAYKFASKQLSGDIIKAVDHYGGPANYVGAFIAQQADADEASYYRANLHQLHRIAAIVRLASSEPSNPYGAHGFLWGSMLGLASGRQTYSDERWSQISYLELNEYYLSAQKDAWNEVETGGTTQTTVLPSIAMKLIKRFGSHPDFGHSEPHVAMAYDYASDYSRDSEIQLFVVAGILMITEPLLERKATMKSIVMNEEKVTQYAQDLAEWDGFTFDT